MSPQYFFFAVKEEIAPKLRDRLGYILTVERKRERERARAREREIFLGTILSHNDVRSPEKVLPYDDRESRFFFLKGVFFPFAPFFSLCV